MSVQLIVFPQYFDGSTPLSSPSTEFVVDGNNFNNVNTSVSAQSVAGSLPQAFVDTYTIFGFSIFMVNTWFRFSGVASEVDGSGDIDFSSDEGIVQRLSNLTIGATYDLKLFLFANSTNLKIYQYKGNVLKSSHTITGTGTHTILFDAYSTADIIVIYSVNSTATISEMSCVLSTSTPSGVFTDLSNGQVICDLYEDEDIPLSLSIDDFKNVAEKVQSYSKAFNLPATKRNNKIFDNIFDITRTDTGLNFNPYKRTKAILKQDGFLLFEGYLRMIDISDKSGETSYNVNLYSEVVALADVLGDKTFSELDFTELEHEYNKIQITVSWNDAPNSGITYTNPNTSGFRDANSTVKYPFVDWNKEWFLAAAGGTPTAGNPQLTTLETAFRPFINIKYLIDRIFQAVPFTYESEFFDTDDFKKLYMDFNWGADNNPVTFNYSRVQSQNASQTATSSFTTIVVPSGTPNFYTSEMGYSSGVFTAQVDSQTYTMDYYFPIGSTGAPWSLTHRWKWYHASTGLTDYINVTPMSGASVAQIPYPVMSGNFTRILMTGDTLNFEFQSLDTPSTVIETSPNITASQPIGNGAIHCVTSVIATTTDTMLQTLRGELGQWDFLKGLMTLFNLVTLVDEDNPNNILIEPYSDVFIPTATAGNTLANRGIEHDWTDKIDVSEMKLMPLTDLNKKTIFKFVEDEDDFAFMNYKRQVGGHLYGSKKYDASEFTILTGEDEIIAEPFAATVVKPLEDIFPNFITPALYAMNDDGTSEGFENSPRIMYNNGVKSTGASYYIPAQNGVSSSNEDDFLQFSHLTNIPTITGTRDFHFGECQLYGPGSPTNNNLFNLYWLPYYSELYNPDTRIMTIKVNLSPSDINTFKFNDTIFIKNRTFRVNKIDYKPNDLATVEFILIP